MPIGIDDHPFTESNSCDIALLIEANVQGRIKSTKGSGSLMVLVEIGQWDVYPLDTTPDAVRTVGGMPEHMPAGFPICDA